MTRILGLLALAAALTAATILFFRYRYEDFIYVRAALVKQEVAPKRETLIAIADRAALRARSDITLDIPLAKALIELGERDRAVALLRRIHQESPNDMGVRLLLADTLSAAGRVDEAQEQYTALRQMAEKD